MISCVEEILITNVHSNEQFASGTHNNIYDAFCHVLSTFMKRGKLKQVVRR
jgi:hypothetical protein